MVASPWYCWHLTRVRQCANRAVDHPCQLAMCGYCASFSLPLDRYAGSPVPSLATIGARVCDLPSPVVAWSTLLGILPASWIVWTLVHVSCFTLATSPRVSP